MVHLVRFQIELQPSDVDLERVVEEDDSTEPDNHDALEEVIMQFVVLETLLSDDDSLCMEENICWFP